MGDQELKPCPFCGSGKIMVSNIGLSKINFAGICVACDAEGPFAMSIESGIENWNRRTAPSSGDPVEGWRPIESAPKTGEHIFAICADAYTPTPFETWWLPSKEGWEHRSRPEEKYSGGLTIWWPSHWMPKSYLPAPPSNEEGRKA